MSCYLNCPNCRAVLSVVPGGPGGRVGCPRCGKEMQLPASAARPTVPLGAAVAALAVATLLIVVLATAVVILWDRSNAAGGLASPPQPGPIVAVAPAVAPIATPLPLDPRAADIADDRAEPPPEVPPRDMPKKEPWPVAPIVAVAERKPPLSARAEGETRAGFPLLTLEPFAKNFLLESSIADRGFVIIGGAEGGIAVKGVIYNGFYLAKPVVWDANGIWMKEVTRALPLRLGIGESLAVKWRVGTLNCPDEFDKQIIYIDVNTDRGVFRFAPDGQYVGPGKVKSAAELERMTAAEDKARRQRVADAEARRIQMNRDMWRGVLDFDMDKAAADYRTRLYGR